MKSAGSKSAQRESRTSPSKDQLKLFSELNLSPALQQQIAAANFITPTPVQAGAIPPAMEGRDVIATAQTGTGKTLSFLIPLIERMPKAAKGATALVLLPTRELAMQVLEHYRHLTQSKGTAALVCGGLAEGPQLDAIRRGARLIVATPGRLEDYLDRKLVNLSGIKILVLDEVDRMLDMGFKPAIRRIAAALPADRQTLCYSATLSPEIRDVARDYLKNPVRIEIGSVLKPSPNVELQSFEVPTDKKQELLEHLLGSSDGSFLVFVRTKHGADRVARRLVRSGHSATQIHGDRSQSQRNAALRQLCSGTSSHPRRHRRRCSWHRCRRRRACRQLRHAEGSRRLRASRRPHRSRLGSWRRLHLRRPRRNPRPAQNGAYPRTSPPRNSASVPEPQERAPNPPFPTAPSPIRMEGTIPMPSTLARLLRLIPLLFLVPTLHAQADQYSLYQLSGNYSWLSNSIDGVPGARQPLNGWDAAFAALRWHGVRFKLDVSGYSGTNQGAPQHPVFIMAGGQFNRRFGRETGFVEGLFGTGSMNRNWLPNNVPGQTASFSAITGGGLDTRLSKRFAFRAQADFQYANFNPGLAIVSTLTYVEEVHHLPNYFAKVSTGFVWNF